MFTGFKIPQVITILFAFTMFLRNVGGSFHIVNIGIPIGLILILSILNIISTRKTFENYSYFTILLLFMAYLFVGTFYSNAPNYGRTKTFGLFIFVVMAIISGKYIISNFNLFLKSNLFFFILFFISYFAFYGSFGNVLKIVSEEDRLGMGGEAFRAIATSQYIGFNLISLYFFIFRQNIDNRFKYLIFGFMFVLGFFMMILFGSKGPILSLILAPLIFIFLYQRYSLKMTLTLVVAIIGISFIFLFPETIIKIIPQHYQEYFYERFFNYDSYATARPSLIKNAISDIDQNTLIFGKGTGNYGFLYSKMDVRIHPHNIFVEFLYENGIFGLLFFIIILFRFLFVKTSVKYFMNIKSFLIVMVFFYLLCAQVSGDFANNFSIFVYLILIFYQIENEKEVLFIFQLINKTQKKTAQFELECNQHIENNI